MRTSLNDIRLIEEYLAGTLPAPMVKSVEARIKREPTFLLDIFLQKKLYRILRNFHRRKLRKSVIEFHAALFNDPEKIEFQTVIAELFKK